MSDKFGDKPIDTESLIGVKRPCVISESDDRKVIHLGTYWTTPAFRAKVVIVLSILTALGIFFWPDAPGTWFAVIVGWGLGGWGIWPRPARHVLLILSGDQIAERTTKAGQDTDRSLRLAIGSRVEFTRDSEDNRITGLRVFGAEDVLDLSLPLNPSEWEWLRAELADWISQASNRSAESPIQESQAPSPEAVVSPPTKQSSDFITTRLIIQEDSPERFRFQMRTSGWARLAMLFLLFVLVWSFLFPKLAPDRGSYEFWLWSLGSVLAVSLIGTWAGIRWLEIEGSVSRTEIQITRHLFFWPRSRTLSNGLSAGVRLDQNVASGLTGREKEKYCLSLFGEFGAERFGSLLRAQHQRGLVQRIRRLLGQDESFSLFAIEPSITTNLPNELNAEELPANAPLKLLAKSSDEVLLRLELCDARTFRDVIGILSLLGGVFFAVSSFRSMLTANAEWTSRLTEALFGIGAVGVFVVGLFLLFGHIRIHIDREFLSRRYGIGPLGWTRRVALSPIEFFRIGPLRPEHEQNDLWDRRCNCRVVAGSQGFEITKLHSGAVATLLIAVLQTEVNRLRA